MMRSDSSIEVQDFKTAVLHSPQVATPNAWSNGLQGRTLHTARLTEVQQPVDYDEAVSDSATQDGVAKPASDCVLSRCDESTCKSIVNSCEYI